MAFQFSQDDNYRRRVSQLRLLANASGWAEKEFEWCHRRIRRHTKELQKIQQCVLAEQTHEARRLGDHVLGTLRAGIAAMLDPVSSRKPIELPPMPLKEFLRQARRCRPTKRLFASAKVIRQRKPNGGKRIVLSPDPTIRRAQNSVAQVLNCWTQLFPTDYSGPNLGTAAAVREVRRLILEEGLTTFITLDFANSFPSVKPKHLKGQLPLPKEVINETVCFNRHVILYHRNGTGEARAARHGLPAGARLSGTVAGMLQGRGIRNVCGDKGKPVAYVDDYAIGVCDPTGALDLAKALQDWRSNIQGGPLSFKFINVVDAREGFAFLSYWIRLVTADDGSDQVILTPTHAAKTKLRKRLFEKLKKLGPDASYEKQCERAIEYAHRWSRAFSEWKPSETQLVNLEDEVVSLVGDYRAGLTMKFPLKVGSNFSA